MYSQGSATDDDRSLTASSSDCEENGERNSLRCPHNLTWLVVASAIISSSYSPEELVKPKDPNKSADEQQGATEGNNDLADRKIERKRKREESSAGNTCKKSKVS